MTDGTYVTNSIEALGALWRESERKLYPLATSVPHQYEQAIRLARAVADVLADVTSTEDLVLAWQRRSAIVRQGVDAAGGVLGPLPEGDVAGVAFALRHSEIKALEASESQRNLIAAARERGEPWITLQRRGTLEHGLADPYQSLEMHAASGLSIVSSVQPDLTTGAASYVLSVIALDPASGAIVDMDPDVEPFVEVDSPAAHDAEHARLRRSIERRGSG